MIALAPINIIVVTRKKVTMHKENKVNRRNGFRYIRRETVGFWKCQIVFISRRRRGEDLLSFS